VLHGENHLEIEVQAALRNRLVGYGKQYAQWSHHRKKALMPAGIIGPVRVIRSGIA